MDVRECIPPFLLIFLLQGAGHLAPRRPWALTMDAVRPITVPSPVRDDVIAQLEYQSADSVHGAAVDLNHDGRTDYVVQSAHSLCVKRIPVWRP